uniref:MlaE family lipid ABC transporter permease subunit n=1 Tax=Cyanidium sp. THAL103 TaxID=3027999 RepID=A0A9Y1MYJ5_9RHOD|nr:MlaE family lipid ABC transporter permease subunit [Cyanidium sp. THAL103]
MLDKFNNQNNCLIWIKKLKKTIDLSYEIIFYLINNHYNNLSEIMFLEQFQIISIQSITINILAGFFIGSIITIQIIKELLNFQAVKALGGLISIVFIREISPIITAIIMTARIGSAFTAEIGTMQITEQIDALYLLKTHPIKVLILPRLIICTIILPFLMLISFITSMSASIFISVIFYNIEVNTFLISIKNTITINDILNSFIKSLIFGFLISIISCSWGITIKEGGSKEVSLSTTVSVVTNLILIFAIDLILSFLMYHTLENSFKKIL